MTASDERIYKRGFWLGVFDARLLALFRISFSTVLLWDVLERLRDFHTFYTDRGMFPRATVFPGRWVQPPHWSLFALAGDAPMVGLIYAGGVLALLALLVGYRTRLASVCSWIFLLSLQRRQPNILDGADAVESVLLFWLMWCDSGAQLSLDVRLGRRAPQLAVRALPVRLIQLQIACIYFFTALGKSDVNWYNGAALGRVLQLTEFARPTAAWILRFPTLCRLLSMAIPPSEAAIGLLMLTPWRRARQLAVMAAFALHGSILLLMDVGMFSLLMPAAVIIVLCRPVVVESLPPLSKWQIVPAALMAIVLVSLALEPWPRALPTPLARVLMATDLGQSWPMFGPDPGGSDYFWHAPAVRSDGRPVDDLFPEIAPQLLTRISHFSYARWLKLREAMWSELPRRQVAAYLCRRYLADSDVPLRSLDLMVTQRYIAPNGKTQMGPTRKLLHQECLPSRDVKRAPAAR